MLIHNDSEIFLNEHKAAILKNYFQKLIGTTKNATWNFNLLQLYPATLPQLRDLANPFSQEEIHQAFLSMNTNASPGPDGFGPIFFRKYWHEIKHSILTFFAAFHDQTASLDRFNRAYMVLIPKTIAPTSPDAFRPISLQNCTPKAVAKVLTNRVKPLIPLLIHYDQT